MRSMIFMIPGALAILFGAAAAADDVRSEGRRFFNEHVLPRLAENGCPACHAVNYIRPNVIKYEELLPYLAMGDAPERSAVIRKIANLRALLVDRPTHPGGQRCKTLDSEPCHTIMQWWVVEFGTEKP